MYPVGWLVEMSRECRPEMSLRQERAPIAADY